VTENIAVTDDIVAFETLNVVGVTPVTVIVLPVVTACPYWLVLFPIGTQYDMVVAVDVGKFAEVVAPVFAIVFVTADWALLPETLLSFQTTTFPPEVVLTVAPELLNIVFASAPSNHKQHPPIVVGSKSHIFFDTGNTKDAIVYLKQSISVRCSAVYKCYRVRWRNYKWSRARPCSWACNTYRYR
jgi:hypothetical protein